MSTKKDGIKVSKTPTIKQSSSRLVTKVREDSADRKHVKKVEDQIKKLKPPTTLLKQKSVDANRPQPTKSNFKLKSASGTSSEETKLKVKRSVAGVSKTRFFPNSKAMISNALKDGDTEVAKISGSKVSGKVDTEMAKVKSSSRKESNSVSNKSISKISKSGSNSHTSNKRDANELKGKTSSTATRSKVNSTPVPKQKQSDSDCSSISSRYEMKSIAKVKSTSKDTSRQTYLDSNSDIMSERPGTATLRKGRLVNTNIVGPEVPEELVPKLVKEHSMLLKPFEFRSESKSKGKSVSRKETKGSKTKPNANEKSPNSSAGSRHSLRNANLEIPSTSKTKLKDKPSDTENEQIVTPMNSEGSHKSDSSNERDYEDDFNSYESDFEKYSSSSSSLHVPDISGEDTSSISSSEGNSPLELTSATKRLSSAGTDEDKQMDSGHYDMPDYKHKQILDNIKELVEKENANLDVQKNNTASLSDEGFEDQRSLQFINFLDAQKKTIRRRSMEIRKKRGEEILSMIKLDTFSYTLFDLTPVPYEVFIKNYGRTNTVQSATQTGDDDIDEEIQTDNISVDMKWTQIPVCFSKLSLDEPSFWRTYKNEYLGVGSEYTVEPNLVKKPCNEHYLNKFLLSAGTLITKILEERDSENISSLKKNSRDLPFSDGYIAFNTTKSALRGSSVDYISFGCDNNKVFATVHTQKDKHMYVIAIWRAYSEEPKLVLESYSAISSCLVDLSSCFVYGGLYDGQLH
ncbi:unnamed protein product [Acanthoscelides obtectus]|uniref:Uncharacterized protein n=1 Tax=Acanthoscelides obtectus TaxID=200917 RepID=A0A9P0LCG1_ACAOB|nr:unnamed protein product [Acanthoscelides obtectus]CAK1649708.1 WD repeat-containing protein 60 [Acanthoscelides obtectus]